MGLINVPDRRIRKPIGMPQIDWDDPLNRGLVGHWGMFPYEFGGKIVHDLSGNGNTGTIIGALWTITAKGAGVHIDVGFHRLIADSSVYSQAKGSIVMGVVRKAVRSAFSTWMNVDNDDNNSPHESVLGTFNENNLKFWPNRDQNVGDYWEFNADYTAVLPLDTPTVIACTWDNGNHIRGYVDGLLYGSETGDSSWTASAWTAGEVLAIGSGSASAANNPNTESNSVIYFFYLYNRVLSPSEIALLSRRPF